MKVESCGELYNINNSLLQTLYARTSIAGGEYYDVRHIACVFGANIDLHKYPLIHHRRAVGPPSPQGRRSIIFNIAVDNYLLTLYYKIKP